MFDEVLRALGLSEGEIKVYGFLLSEGEKTAGEVIKNVRIKRGSAYNFLKSLVIKGLAEESVKNKVAVFRANHPNTLKEYQEHRAAEATQANALLENSLERMVSAYNLSYHKPTVSYFEGGEGIKKIYEDTITKNVGKKILVFRSHLDEEALGIPFFKKYVERRAAVGIRTRIISSTPPSPLKAGEDKKFLKERKYWPNLSLPAEIDIYDNKVAIISFEDGLIGTMIENTAIAAALREIFERVWQSL